jgi:NADH:ubiquinone oxidoreductase subunit 2 (subunit N)
MGLIIFAISLFTIQSIAAALFYLYSYIILMLFTFSFMFFLFERNNDGLFYLDDISQLTIFLSKNLLLSTFFSLILFGLAGLPFFIGFIAK